MAPTVDTLLYGATILVSIHTLLKPVFFLLPYDVRRQQLDRAYADQPSAANLQRSHNGLRVLAGLIVAAQVYQLLTASQADAGFAITPAEASRRELRALARGLWLGATAIQIYFNGFNRDLPKERAAPPQLSPIKRLSYAIQDSPWSADLILLMLLTLFALAFGV